MDFLARPETWIIIAALSEIVALSPLKDNSIVQLIFTAINSIKPAKKGLGNIPADGKWLFRFDTRSNTERIRRFIQQKKFYATLPKKLDQAEKDYHKQQEDLTPKPVFKEEGTFGKDGWSISFKHPSVKDND